MRALLRNKALWSTLAAYVLLGLLCTLRALPAFERGTYATEGGEWLSRMWQTSFTQMIFGARGDYGVLANMVVIKAADMLTNLIGGHSLAACGPFVQHAVAVVYVTLIFGIIFIVLRAHHGGWTALLATAAMLLVPDLDNENRIFGEANNVGFFSALFVLFAYYDLWMRPQASTRRIIAWIALTTFHIFTSPLAGLIAAGWSALLIARAVWLKVKTSAWSNLVLAHGFTILLAVWTVIHAKPEAADENSEAAAHTSAVVLPRLWEHFIELIFCRQLLYPLTFGVYRSMTDGRTLAVLALVTGAVLAWLWLEKRRGNTDWNRVLGLVLLPAIGFCMAFVTVWSRGWLTQMEAPYTKLWPARYYLVQTMVSMGFLALMLLRVGDFFPRFKRDLSMLLIAWTATFAWTQSDFILGCLRHYDPGVVAKHWNHQLARTHDLHAMSSSGKVPANALYDVDMYIDFHSVQVPPAMMESFFQRKDADPTKHHCAIDVTDASRLKADTARRVVWDLDVRNLRAIPRPNGVLVTVDLTLPSAPHFADARRHLWLTLPRPATAMKAWNYAVNVPREQEASKKRLPDIERWLFKVALWFEGIKTADEAQRALTDARCVLGPKPEEYLASSTLLQPHHELNFSSLLDDDSVAVAQHPLTEAFHWAWQPKGLKKTNLAIEKEGIVIDEDAPFDEDAYVRLNPDVATALADKALTSGRAHFDHWGKDETRQRCVHAITIDASTAKLTTADIAGIRIELSKRKSRPGEIRCVLRGPANESSAITIVPAEGDGVFDALQLPTGFLGTAHPVQSIELQFESPQPNRAFRVEDLFIYRRK